MVTTIVCVIAYLVIGALVELYRSAKESEEYELIGVCMWPMTLVAYVMFFAGLVCGVVARWWRFRV